METILKNGDFINQVFAWQKPPDRSAKDAISAYRSRLTVEVMKQMFFEKFAAQSGTILKPISRARSNMNVLTTEFEHQHSWAKHRQITQSFAALLLHC